jgi:hypothetical protein
MDRERFTGLGGKMTKNEDDSLTKLAVAIEKLRKLGVRVTDGTCKGKAIGFVGGVRRPEPKSVDDDNPAGSPKPSVN